MRASKSCNKYLLIILKTNTCISGGPATSRPLIHVTLCHLFVPGYLPDLLYIEYLSGMVRMSPVSKREREAEFIGNVFIISRQNRPQLFPSDVYVGTVRKWRSVEVFASINVFIFNLKLLIML